MFRTHDYRLCETSRIWYLLKLEDGYNASNWGKGRCTVIHVCRDTLRRKRRNKKLRQQSVSNLPKCRETWAQVDIVESKYEIIIRRDQREWARKNLMLKAGLLQICNLKDIPFAPFPFNFPEMSTICENPSAVQLSQINYEVEPFEMIWRYLPYAYDAH